MKRAEFKHIIAFCILMENGQGIRSKEPKYLIEKFKHAEEHDLCNDDQFLYNFYMIRHNVNELYFEDD